MMSLLCAATSPAQAKVMVRAPTIADTCAQLKPWKEISKCLARFGEVKMLRTTQSVRVLSVRQPLDDVESGNMGTYLYVARGTNWMLGGMSGEAGELVGFTEITIGSHRGYRLDFAILERTSVTLDDQTITAGILLTRSSMYCAGENPACSLALTSCDELVRGKAYRTFRGTVRISNDQLAIVGDRTRADSCAPAETVALSWPK
ncbi:MAG: hypothetical protein JWO36_1782 [Myxococcales bacterium]|nr:hypothetical protein [Myxococcales bacterium]